MSLPLAMLSHTSIVNFLLHHTEGQSCPFLSISSPSTGLCAKVTWYSRPAVLAKGWL